MKMKSILLITVFIILSLQSTVFAQKKKSGQSGMTYLAISLGARESAMGNASVAGVNGIQGLFYNQAVLAGFEGFGIVMNQVNWLADTKVYGIGAAYGLGNLGTFGVDLVYMDYGKIVGTRRVDKNVDPRGFITTGDLNIQDYALGFAYAYPVNDRFSFGVKFKYVHEDLGTAQIAVKEIDVEKQLYDYQTKAWKLNHWGFDFGGYYKVGYKDLALGVAFQNYSTDMEYWTEAFQMPLVLRMGMAMDLATILLAGQESIEINTSFDVLHPIDYTERVHIGTEVVYQKIIALRAGYKFNYDVENFSLGFGINFNYQGYKGVLDYAYTNAEYFSSVNRISFGFTF